MIQNLTSPLFVLKAFAVPALCGVLLSACASSQVVNESGDMPASTSVSDWNRGFESSFSAQRESVVVLPRYRVAGGRVKVITKNANQTATAVSVGGGALVEKFEPGAWRAKADEVTIRNGFVELKGMPQLVRGGTLTRATEATTIIKISGNDQVEVIGASSTLALNSSERAPAAKPTLVPQKRAVTPTQAVAQETPKPQADEVRPTAAPAVEPPDPPKKSVATPNPATTPALVKSEPVVKPKPAPAAPKLPIELPKMRVPDE